MTGFEAVFLLFFCLSPANKGEAQFELDGLTMQTSGFEQFIFADGSYSYDWLMA